MRALLCLAPLILTSVPVTAMFIVAINNQTDVELTVVASANDEGRIKLSGSDEATLTIEKVLAADRECPAALMIFEVEGSLLRLNITGNGKSLGDIDEAVPCPRNAFGQPIVYFHLVLTDEGTLMLHDHGKYLDNTLGITKNETEKKEGR